MNKANADCASLAGVQPSSFGLHSSRILVTGGAGFLGLYITEQLIARGNTVRVISRRPHPRLAELGAEWQGGDIRDPAAAERACRSIDTVFHVAAIPGIWGPWKLF